MACPFKEPERPSVIETFEEAKQACDEIERLAQAVIEGCDHRDAEMLIRQCRGMKTEMIGRFGNIGEQLTKIVAAARLFTLSTFCVTDAEDALRRAVREMQGALRAHQRSAG